MIPHIAYKKFVFGKVILFWFVTTIPGIISSQADNTDNLLNIFSEELSSDKQVLDQLSLDIAAHKQWFKNYQSQLLSEKNGELEDSLNRQLNKIWQEIERLEPLTKSIWLDNISKQLDSNAFADVPPSEIESLMASHNQYISQIQTDVLFLEHIIEQAKQVYSLPEETEIAQTSDVSEIIDVSFPTKENDVLETTLLYLLAGLEAWGSWLEPTNTTGLLPEAEGRFMMSNTPILQTGVVPGGIGVVGFAQPIIINHNGIPDGFSEDGYLYELPIGYNDYIEDVFQQVPYLDRLNYQYGAHINGRTVQIYRKPIEVELRLATMLQGMGAPPEVSEIWVAEYAEIAHLPQTIQLSWLIAGNPLTQDYQVYIADVLTTLDLNTLLVQNANGRDFTLPEAPSNQWVNQDPFWEEVQKQPFLNTFTELLNNVSEEVKRSFIVSLFFVEFIPLGTGAATRSSTTKTNNNANISLRSKPFFWPDAAPTLDANSPTSPIVDFSIDPDQSLVAEAIKQKNNLIKYWIPGQGYQIIPWSERGLLNPNNQGTPYFIMAVTVLSQFAPVKKPQHESNYEVIVSSVINDHLPQNQPVFKVFTGLKKIDRTVVDNKGSPIYFDDNTFLWTAEQLDNDAIMQYATNHHEWGPSPYAVVSIDNGPYISGGLPKIKQLFEARQDYTVETVVLKAKGTTYHKSKPVRNSSLTVGIEQGAWLHRAGKVAQDIFDWSFPKQDRLFIQSTHRFAEFERSNGLNPEIKTSFMVIWKDLPSNEELLNERSQWSTNIFLVRVQQGYFLIHVDELEYLQAHAGEEFQIHSLLVSGSTETDFKNSIHRALQDRNLGCESVRVLSTSGAELAYSPQCFLVATESGLELAGANEGTQLAAAQKGNQPIVIFRPEGKSASAVPLKRLLDAEQDTLENLQVSTIVPIYDLEGLDTEEKESAIGISITDAISRTLQFFPEQKEFEVLMPEAEFIQKWRAKYTSIPLEDPIVEYDYDKINVTVPAEGRSVTFYRLKEGVIETASQSIEY